MTALACPACASPARKVIYLALPMKLCSAADCSTLWGFWSFAAVPFFNGYFLAYEGSYFRALWHWFTATDTEMLP